MIYKTSYESEVGELLLVSDGENLLALLIGKEKYGDKLAENAVQKDDLPLFDDIRNWLDRYFRGEKPDLNELPLAPEGSEFRHMVWDILKGIPYGSVVTYGHIAGLIAQKTGKQKMSAQAVGGAVGHNPISIIIPCHRVVGSDGSLTGFGGGIQAKVKLLEHEDVDMSEMYIPKKGTAL